MVFIMKKRNNTEELTRIMLHSDGLEPITDSLIKKLIKEKRMKRKDLEFFRDEGAKYSVSRSSFFFPPEINGFDK